MGWGQPSTVDPVEALRTAYDILWHRCRAHPGRDGLTANLPSPHQLRTGQTPDQVRARTAAYNAGIPWLEHHAGCMRTSIPDPSHANLRGPIVGCDCACHDTNRPIAPAGRAG